MELTPTQKLDEVLKIMATSFAVKPIATDEQIYKELKAVHPEVAGQNDLWSEVISILEKLVRDGYVTISDPLVYPAKYKITFEGKILNKNGGYEREHALSENAQAATVFRDKMLVCGTWFAGVGAFVLVLWDMYKTFCLHLS